MQFTAPVLFTVPTGWVKPRTPSHTAGYLIIETDDGNIGDYTNWLPLARKLAFEYSGWLPNRTVPCCPNVNTITIGESGKMTEAHLQELQDKHKWEIMSHGRHHVGVGLYELASAASTGENQITLSNFANRIDRGHYASVPPYEYLIKDGATEEVVGIDSVNTGTNVVTLNTNLVNNYSADATMRMTDDSMDDLLQGCLDDLAAWGINASNHVYTWHAGAQAQHNPDAVEKVREIFDTARGSQANDGVNDPDTVDLVQLAGMLFLHGDNTLEVIDTALDSTASNDHIFIIYGHGEAVAISGGKLEHIIRGALNRGIKIVNRKQIVGLFN